MNENAAPKRERRPYSSPEVKRVELKTEESLAAGCKTSGTSAPGASPCNSNSCFNLGS